MRRLLGANISNDRLFDTLHATRALWPDIRERDQQNHKVPPTLHGSHSLKAWGLRLGVLKGDFHERTDWAAWSVEMMDYCVQDCVANYALYGTFAGERTHCITFIGTPSQRMEIEVAGLLAEVTDTGMPFDMAAATALRDTLDGSLREQADGLQALFPPKIVEEEWTPKRNNQKLGRVKGVPIIKRREVPFNVYSPEQVRERIYSDLGVTPTMFAKTMLASTSKAALAQIDRPEARAILNLKVAGKNQNHVVRQQQGRQRRHRLDQNGPARHPPHPWLVQFHGDGDVSLFAEQAQPPASAPRHARCTEDGTARSGRALGLGVPLAVLL